MYSPYDLGNATIPVVIIILLLFIGGVVFTLLYEDTQIYSVEYSTTQKIDNEIYFDMLFKNEKTGQIKRSSSPEVWAKIQSFKRIQLTTYIGGTIKYVKGIE